MEIESLSLVAGSFTGIIFTTKDEKRDRFISGLGQALDWSDAAWFYL